VDREQVGLSVGVLVFVEMRQETCESLLVFEAGVTNIPTVIQVQRRCGMGEPRRSDMTTALNTGRDNWDRCHFVSRPRASLAFAGQSASPSHPDDAPNSSPPRPSTRRCVRRAVLESATN
jgi:hypothetical protein